MELAKAVALFLGEYKPSTRKAYAHALRPMRDWLGPARELTGITPVLLIEYVQTWVEPRGVTLVGAPQRENGRSGTIPLLRCARPPLRRFSGH